MSFLGGGLHFCYYQSEFCHRTIFVYGMYLDKPHYNVIPTQTPSGRLKVAICIHQVDSPFYLCGLMSTLVICKLRKECAHT